MKARPPFHIMIIAFIFPVFVFSTAAEAREGNDSRALFHAFWYMVGQFVDGGIAELDLSANHVGKGGAYPVLGVGLQLRKGAVYTGFRAGINPALAWQPDLPQGYFGWALGYTDTNGLMGSYRFDILYGIEPVSDTRLIEPRYTGKFKGWARGPSHRRDMVEWAVSYRYAYEAVNPAVNSSLMLHLIVSRFGSESPASY